MNATDPDAGALRDPQRAHGERGDFASAHRLPAIAAIAAVIGACSALAAWALLHLIRVFTNLFFFQTLSDRLVSPATNTLGPAVIAVPAIGGLVIGLMARYGSEKIRGHGIPEAIEAILFNKSRMSPKVAALKPIDREALAAGLQRPGVARVADLFGPNVPAMALPDENCRVIANRLAVHGLERLPVVTDPQSRRLVGIITRSDLVKPSLAIGQEEHQVERFFEPPLKAARDRFRALTEVSRRADRDDGEDV